MTHVTLFDTERTGPYPLAVGVMAVGHGADEADPTRSVDHAGRPERATGGHRVRRASAPRPSSARGASHGAAERVHTTRFSGGAVHLPSIASVFGQ